MAQGSEGGEVGDAPGFAGNGGIDGIDADGLGHADGFSHGEGHSEHHGLHHAPSGSLIHGMSAGHGFLHHLVPHTDHAGHGHAGSVFDRETMAQHIAIEALMHFGEKTHTIEAHGHDHANHGKAGLDWHATGHLCDHPSFKSFAGRCPHLAKGREVNLPGIGRTDSTVEVLCYPHGPCDPEGAMRTLASEVRTGTGILSFLKLDGLEPIQPPVVNAPTVFARTEYQLAPLSPFNDKANRRNMPNGFYRHPCAHGEEKVWHDATGTTRIWRSLYQVIPCQLPFFGSKFMNWQTFLVVFGSTWHYKETDDYETRVALSIWSLPFVEFNYSQFRWDRIKQHREAAEKLATGLWRYLKRHPASDRSIKARAEMEPEPAVVCDAETGECERVDDSGPQVRRTTSFDFSRFLGGAPVKPPRSPGDKQSDGPAETD